MDDVAYEQDDLEWLGDTEAWEDASAEAWDAAEDAWLDAAYDGRYDDDPDPYSGTYSEM